MIEAKAGAQVEGRVSGRGKRFRKLLAYSFLVAIPLVSSILIYKSISERHKAIQQEAAIIEHRKEAAKQYAGLSAAELKSKIQCPNEAGEFIESMYGPDSFCQNAARAIAYLICDDGFKPMPIVLKKNGDTIHWVCAFETRGRYGCVDNGIFGYIPPIFRNIDELVRHIESSEKLWRLSWEGIKTGLLLDENYADPKGLENILDALEMDKNDKK